MTELLAVLAITIIAVISPGPDFAVVSRNSLASGRAIGAYTALGIALGVFVHVGYAVAGIGLIISQSIIAFTIMKVIGGCYLIYLGIQTFRHASNEVGVAGQKLVSPMQAVRWGFLTNATNPKTSLFVVALFLQVVSSETSTLVQAGYGLIIAGAHLVWFGLVATFFSSPPVRNRLLSWKKGIERFFGTALVFFGGSLIATASNTR
ncbi:MAG: LysE family transporter [Hyphomicrobiales bacterium]